MIQKTICLNMIVKDECDVIERCLFSVKPIIDYWVIVDTGSSDSTKDLIIKALRGIPGELYERSWVNFSHNRNEALELARGKSDYLLFMDADETLVIDPSFKKSDLEEDFYLFRLIERSHTDFYRVSLIRDLPYWFWRGLYHEAIDSSQAMSGRKFEKIVKHAFMKDGNQSKNPNKFLQEAEWIEGALANDPENSRYVFYLAQSYGNAKHYEKALQWYRKRTQMAGGDLEEIFWSFYCMGMIEQYIYKEEEKWIQHYTEAHLIDPSRAEPIFQWARHLIDQGKPLLGYMLLKRAVPLKKPSCSGYFHAWIYDYAFEWIWGEAADKIGQKEEALSIYQTLLQKEIPDEIKTAIQEWVNKI